LPVDQFEIGPMQKVGEMETNEPAEKQKPSHAA
jgi:hypothetical protein